MFYCNSSVLNVSVVSTFLMMPCVSLYFIKLHHRCVGSHARGRRWKLKQKLQYAEDSLEIYGILCCEAVRRLRQDHWWRYSTVGYDIFLLQVCYAYCNQCPVERIAIGCLFIDSFSISCAFIVNVTTVQYFFLLVTLGVTDVVCWRTHDVCICSMLAQQ